MRAIDAFMKKPKKVVFLRDISVKCYEISNFEINIMTKKFAIHSWTFSMKIKSTPYAKIDL